MLSLAVTAACGGQRPSGVAPAPSTPEATVQQFLAATNAGNLEAMGALWGDERGPVPAGNETERQRRNQRLTIMQRLLRSDSFAITESNVMNPSRPVLTVAMRQGTRSFSVPFTLVQPGSGGWLINDIGLEAAMPAAGPRQP